MALFRRFSSLLQPIRNVSTVPTKQPRKKCMFFSPFGTVLSCREEIPNYINPINDCPYYDNPYYYHLDFSPKTMALYEQGKKEVEALRDVLGFYVEKPTHRFNFKVVTGEDGYLKFTLGDGPVDLRDDPENQAWAYCEMYDAYMELYFREMPDVQWEVRTPSLFKIMESIRREYILVCFYWSPEAKEDFLKNYGYHHFDEYVAAPCSSDTVKEVCDKFHVDLADVVMLRQGEDSWIHDIAETLDVNVIYWRDSVFSFQDLASKLEVEI